MVKYPKKGQNIPLFFLKHICEGLKINISKNDPMYFQLEIAQCFISESFRKIGDKKYFSQICLMELSQRTEERSQRVFRNSTMIVPTIIAYPFLNPGFSIFVRGGTEQKKSSVGRQTVRVVSWMRLRSIRLSCIGSEWVRLSVRMPTF